MAAEAIKEIVIGPNSIFQRDKETVREGKSAVNAFKNLADKSAVGFFADLRTNVAKFRIILVN